MHQLLKPLAGALTLLLLLSGCSEDLVAVEDTADPSLNALTSTSNGAHASSMVPLKGRWTAQADPSAGIIICTDPSGTPTPNVVLPAVIRAEGHVTHLGRTQTVITGEECVFDPSNGTITTDGSAVHTGANGDAIYAKFQNVVQPDGSFGSDNKIRFVGGTGRFEHVRGRASSAGTFNFQTLTGSFTIDGWITPVGASRK